MKCLDDDGKEVTEYLDCVKSGDPLEFFLDFINEANVLEECYSRHANLKTKFLIQSCRQALSGRFAGKWREFSGDLRLSKNNGNGNKRKFNEALQKCCRALFLWGAYEDQRDYLGETWRLGDLPTEEYIECVRRIFALQTKSESNFKESWGSDLLQVHNEGQRWFAGCGWYPRPN